MPAVLRIQKDRTKKAQIVTAENNKDKWGRNINKWQPCAVRDPCTVDTAKAAIILNSHKPPHLLSTSSCFRQNGS